MPEGFCKSLTVVFVSLYAWFVADLRSQGVLVSPPSIQIGCGQGTMAETTDSGPGTIYSPKHLSSLEIQRGPHGSCSKTRGDQVPMLPTELSPSVICPGLESRHTANGTAPHDDPVNLPGMPAQDQAVSFSISRFHEGRTTNPCHSTVLPHRDQPLLFTWNFLRRDRGDCWW